jgi:hypothetical protein
MLQRIAAAAVHRRIDLDVPPGEHQQAGAKGLHRGQEHPIHIQQGHGGQIQNPLGNVWETLMDVIGQINGPDRENGVAGQAHQQDPVRTHGENAAADLDANNWNPRPGSAAGRAQQEG